MRTTHIHTPDSPLSFDLSDVSDDPFRSTFFKSTSKSAVISHSIRWVRLLVPLALILVLAACGPEPDDSNAEALTAETRRIAQDYGASGDIARARTALSNLDVANSNQWLVYVAEQAIVQEPASPLTNALVKLSLDLSLRSANIEQKAIELGLLVPTPVVVAQANAAPVIQSTPAVAPAAPQVEQAAPQVEDTTAPSAPADEPAPADAPSAPVVSAINGLNVRSGPSTAYQIVGSLETGQTAEATGKNAQGDWWQVLLSSGQQGWVLGQLVNTAGDFTGVAVPANIPAPPPPTAVPPTATPEPPPEPEQPAEPPRSGNNYVLIEKRLWSADENGGRMDGVSVVCGEKRELHVKVVNSAGSLVNGVSIQAQYGAKEIFVTGAQGKGEGKAEFVLGDGQDVKVVKDANGNPVSSDLAAGLVTVPYQIPFEYLIASGYCTDDASCQKNVVDPYACGGHFSWSVTFQENF